MVLKNQNQDEESCEKENYLESSSLIELPSKSLTELEQDYYDIIHSNYFNKETLNTQESKK
jgi:hypothetical protein